MPPLRHWMPIAFLAALSVSIPTAADAFCGFYVSGTSEELYNHATQVSLLRDGQTTVMAMRNDYQGPPEDFAMVVPVPEVLEKEQVKTLEDGVFDRLRSQTGPRLVEYHQQDPCAEPPQLQRGGALMERSASGAPRAVPSGSDRGRVKVEARFDVGEYQIVVLSSNESNALDTWLREHDYKIPGEAPKYFRPYIERGSYFFVAKVDVSKVQFEEGRAMLSPLRFHYESKQFRLPIRLGLVNSDGAQDLLVHILAEDQRYDVANRENVTIPTNLPVSKKTKDHFGTFYETLFRGVLTENPGAVVTEYAWEAGKCDPCPPKQISESDFATLGGNVVVDSLRDEDSKSEDSDDSAGGGLIRPFGPPTNNPMRGWVVTRLHARYSADEVGEDLVFEKAPAIRGGRGEPTGKNGWMEPHDEQTADRNRFQARYAVLHRWSGEVACDDPNWNRWGGRGGGAVETSVSEPGTGPSPEESELQARTLVDWEGVRESKRSELKETIPTVQVAREDAAPESIESGAQASDERDNTQSSGRDERAGDEKEQSGPDKSQTDAQSGARDCNCTTHRRPPTALALIFLCWVAGRRRWRRRNGEPGH